MNNTNNATTILHVPRRFVASDWGGLETVVLELSREQQQQGFNPQVVTSLALSHQREETLAGIPVRRFPYFYPFFGLTPENRAALDKKGGNLVSWSLFAHLLRAKNVRVYHAHTLKRLGAQVRTAARWRNKPFVATLHGGVFDVPQEEQQQLQKPTQKTWEWGKGLGAFFGSRRLLEDADCVICVGYNEFEKAKTQLPHDRVAFLPNGVRPERFSRGNGWKFRQKHGLAQESFLVLNISRIDSQKNQGLLVQAFAALRQNFPNARLILAGPVTQLNYARDLQRLIEDLELSQNAQILPAIPYDAPELADAYQACDVFALPSLHEPFGIVVLEAWSSGKPVVASRIGGLAHLVHNDENGLFFNPNSPDAPAELARHLLTLAQHPAHRAQLGDAGLREVERAYTWTQISRRQEEIYQQAEAHLKRRQKST